MRASKATSPPLASPTMPRRSSATSCSSNCLPLGAKLAKGDGAAVVESVKAASDVFAPLSGEVVEVNAAVDAQPGLINEDAMGRGWIFKIKLADPGELAALLSEADYSDFLKTLA